MTWLSGASEDNWSPTRGDVTWTWAVPDVVLDEETVDGTPHAYTTYAGLPLITGQRDTSCDRRTLLTVPIVPGDPRRRCHNCLRAIEGHQS